MQVHTIKDEMWRRSINFFAHLTAILLISALFCLVFAYSGGKESFILIYKIYSFSFLVGAAVFTTGVYLVLMSIRGGLVIKLTVIDLLLILWYIYIIANVFYNRSDLAGDKLTFFSLCLSVYVIIRIFINNGFASSFRCVMAYGLLITCIFQALVGLLQFYGLLPALSRSFAITGTFKNPAPFSLFLAACFPICACIYLFLTSKKFKLLRALSMISGFLIILVLPLTGIRTAWLSTICSLLVVLELRYGLLRRLRKVHLTPARKALSMCALVLVVAISGFFIYRLKPASADGRLLIWQITFDKFQNEPVLGAGFSNFKQLYNKWQVGYFIKHPDVLKSRYLGGNSIEYTAGYIKMPYNEYLEIAIEQGIIGFTLFALFIGVVLAKSFGFLKRNISISLIAINGSLVALLFAGIFSYPFYSLPTFYLFFLLIAFVGSSMAERRGISDTLIGETSFSITRVIKDRIFIAVIGLCTLAWSVFWIRQTLFYADKYAEYEHASELYRDNKIFEAERKYKEVFPLLRSDPDYLLDYGICLVQEKEYGPAFGILSMARSIDNDPQIFFLLGNILKYHKEYKEAENMYQTAHLIIPSNAYPKYLLARLYEQYNDSTNAIAMARDILSHPAKDKNSQLSYTIREEMNLLLKKYKIENIDQP